MDVLSDVLMAVRLTGAVFYDVTARPPFVSTSPSSDAIAARMIAGAQRVVSFHVMTDGVAWSEPVDDPTSPLQLRAGEMVIFPGGDGNVMASAPGMRSEPAWEKYHRPVLGLLPMSIVLDDEDVKDADGAVRSRDRETCRYVCGYLGCDVRPFNPLLGSLPEMLHAPVDPRAWNWMKALLDAAVESSQQHDAGREAMLAKLAELMFVEAIRSHIDSLPADAVGWVAGLRDPQVGAALQAIHEHPQRAWTLDLLAREVAMSRSSFAERFTTLVQIPPMTYLTRWRLQLAARLLESAATTVAAAASAVGYESESAFTRAFKRHLGITPGAWRREADRRAALLTTP